ncbi:MAG: sugar phosphate isomerase/epimerase [Cyclobacteriaceae bacterium]
MKRREFIRASAVTAAGLFSMPSTGVAAKIKGQLGLQLYTLRDSIFKDPKDVLQKVAAFGYRELETFSYRDGKIYGMDFPDFGKFIRDLGMRVVSGHYGLDQAKSNSWEKAISDAKAIGQEYMIVPYLVDTDRKTISDYKKICEQLNKAGEACNKQGIRFGYHNHAFEFETLEGQKPFDVMLAELDPGYVGIEMDIYWVVRGGADPLKYFENYPKRFEQWHVKDMDKNNQDRNADVGTGSIDYKSLFAKAKKSGMKHWYVEQESYPGDPMESVSASAKYLKTLL